mmetsp:Transcript_13330/g.31215  ORF Transcript_13330/g.31215 Transcript_13330/m.31215 type:complete len:157 (+) Transcript_13330:123-593(+)
MGRKRGNVEVDAPEPNPNPRKKIKSFADLDDEALKDRCRELGDDVRSVQGGLEGLKKDRKQKFGSTFGHTEVKLLTNKLHKAEMAHNEALKELERRGIPQTALAPIGALAVGSGSVGSAVAAAGINPSLAVAGLAVAGLGQQPWSVGAQSFQANRR